MKQAQHYNQLQKHLHQPSAKLCFCTKFQLLLKLFQALPAPPATSMVLGYLITSVFYSCRSSRALAHDAKAQNKVSVYLVTLGAEQQASKSCLGAQHNLPRITCCAG
jgi:hypothetical protein